MVSKYLLYDMIIIQRSLSLSFVVSITPITSDKYGENIFKHINGGIDRYERNKAATKYNRNATEYAKKQQQQKSTYSFFMKFFFYSRFVVVCTMHF